MHISSMSLLPYYIFKIQGKTAPDWQGQITRTMTGFDKQADEFDKQATLTGYHAFTPPLQSGARLYTSSFPDSRACFPASHFADLRATLSATTSPARIQLAGTAAIDGAAP
jgi:hypothetical protein